MLVMVAFRHPPATTSDLSFTQFFHTVLEYNASTDSVKSKKNLKLDFKSPAAVPKCLEIIRGFVNKLTTEKTQLWLNADIWKGPGDKSSVFKPRVFVEQCKTLLKDLPLTLSLGWTTSGDEISYTKDHIEQAIESLTQFGILRKGLFLGQFVTGSRFKSIYERLFLACASVAFSCIIYAYVLMCPQKL